MTATISSNPSSSSLTTHFRQTWDNSLFFTGTDDPAIATTVASLKADIAQLAEMCESFLILAETADSIDPADYDTLIGQIRSIHIQRTALRKQLDNVSTYISSARSTDTQDVHANTWKPILQKLGADFSQAMTPLNVFLMRASETFITALLADPTLTEMAFSIHHQRQLKDQLLSVTEEQLITALATNGLHAWGNLYSELAGTLKCEIQGNSRGLAQAANLLSHADSTTRQAAWEAIYQAWHTQQSAVAAGLNAINGWRIEETQKRKSQRELHYLDKSCHQSCISRETLDTLMATTYQQREIGQRALSAMAKAMGQNQAHPWDLMAPAPVIGTSAADDNKEISPGSSLGLAQEAAKEISFEAAIALIAKAFNKLTPEMGEFAIMMAEKAG